MLTPGQRLRALREAFRLTIRDVETATWKVAARHNQDEFAIPLSRLSDIETKGIVPSIYRLYSLAVIYRQDLRELLAWYGVDVNEAASDFKVIELAKSHRADTLHAVSSVPVPVRFDPGFDPRRTANLGRMIEQWGAVPLSFLSDFVKTDYTYGYIGAEDLTMYPILPPGSFIQIDQAKHDITDGVWRSEYERPIYFVETRDGYTCSWCARKGHKLILQPHPLSPVPVRILHYPHDAEVIGQVVGVAMKLGASAGCQPLPDEPELRGLN
jgi:transcriptional regulator with XRE-family HTH domain